MQGITQAIDPKDGVCIGGKHLHHNFKPMNNTEQWELMEARALTV